MEIFGILFSIPVAACASIVYSLLVVRLSFINRGYALIMIRALSGIILALIVLEIAVVSTIGAVEARTLAGPTFNVIHITLFFLGVPSLANLFVLGKEDAANSWKYSVTPCTVLAFVLVMMQISVSESLYGIDGEGGPYSLLANPTGIATTTSMPAAFIST
jgi:hypothetical protein